MTARGGSGGLSFGQVVTLTFGFLLASVVIFAFGWWVGYDVAQQRLASEQQVVRLPVAPPPTPAGTPTTGVVAAAVTVLPTPALAALAATKPAATATSRAVATRPPTQPARTSTPTKGRTPTRAATRAASAGWTVQAAATTDTLEAVMLARRLREKGYEAYTATATVDGKIVYRVRVGRFADRTQAKVMELRLKTEEGLGGAAVTPQ
jgi:DedD protein